MIREFATRARINRRRRARLATIAAVAVVALLAASCGESDDSADPVDNTSTTDADVEEDAPGTGSTSTTTTTPTTTTTTTTVLRPTLEERIVTNMQGAQSEHLDEWGDLELGLVFFHRGDWASEALESLTSGEYCERGTYTWSVADATSESDFTIHYDTLTEDPDCFPLGTTRLTAVYSGTREVDGRTVYDFTYTEGTPFSPSTGVRTVCSDQWTDPEPCGLNLAGFEMSTPPQG